MTRKEILQYIKSELANENAEIYLDVDDYKIIVEALEQEFVIDKIRAEIRKKMKFNSFNEGYVLYDDIEEILDKYKAESRSEKGK